MPLTDEGTKSRNAEMEYLPLLFIVSEGVQLRPILLLRMALNYIKNKGMSSFF